MVIWCELLLLYDHMKPGKPLNLLGQNQDNLEKIQQSENITKRN